jgi:hypothetical protein
MVKNNLISEFKIRLSSSLDKTNEFKIILDDDWEQQTGWIQLYDIVLYRQGIPFAVFEFKDNENQINIESKSILNALKITKARYGIFVVGNDYYLLDKGNRFEKLDKLNFENVINYLNNPTSIYLSDEIKQELVKVIFKRVDEFILKNQRQYFLSFLENSNLLEKFRFNPNSNSFCFVDSNKGLESFENQFFNHLLGEFKETKICRYTSLKSFFTSVHNTTFRMNGLVGMNDKTEINYVDDYLNDFPIPFQKLHHNTVSAINKRYISSCSLQSMADNLTMWRLYGDDCKGVCLFYKVNKFNLNNHTLLQKVSYADKSGIHPLLEFLKWIKRDIENILELTFEFGKLRYWKHFFKPFDYSVEKEVRLLVIDSNDVPIEKKNWVLTDNHSILNPVIDIRLNHPDFPLVLSEIILGPKCPESEINKVQIEELLRFKKPKMTFEGKSYSKIDVRISDIKNYR